MQIKKNAKQKNEKMNFYFPFIRKRYGKPFM